MSKRPSLFAVKPATAPAAVNDPQPEVSADIAVAPPAAAKRPPSREGKRVLSVYLTPEAWKQLRMLSLDLGSSTQALGEEAVNLLFEKHRLNRIA
jgi:hypothetical protein